MLTANYYLGSVGLGRSFVPSPGEIAKSADLFVLSNALSSVEHDVAVRPRIDKRASVRIVLFMIVRFSNFSKLSGCYFI